MNAISKVELIKNSPLGKDLSPAHCETLAAIIEVRDLKKGEELLSEGHVDHTLYVPISGKISVIKDSGGGQEDQLHVLVPGELAGAMGFLDGKEHSATLRALTDTQVFCIEQSKFETLVSSEPTIVYQVMRSIVRDIHGIVKTMNNSHVELSNYINKQHGRY
ncbi:MAG: cyclic nucleotide-binding domain-containing protein [Thiotrichaceae bacterium]|nr:cyclic nucleotide-binding domain-containing protein [Thiotrichaceae bacterium]PCI12563.1 MAG: Crp/Fnr family transcriptional regulator [Thiotrichales bacterium]